ncbi:MAG: hypothetical protein ACLPN5_22745, partial [Roseiarcus sp.]
VAEVVDLGRRVSASLCRSLPSGGSEVSDLDYKAAREFVPVMGQATGSRPRGGTDDEALELCRGSLVRGGAPVATYDLSTVNAL